MKNINFLIIGLGIILLSLTFVSAETQTLPKQMVNTCVNLPQVCSTCTYVNLSSIKYPDSTVSNLNAAMTKSGVNYNYTFCDTGDLGTYIVTTCGDKDGTFQCAVYDFDVSPTRSGMGSSYEFYIIILLISSAIIVGGFLIKDAPLTVLGTFGLYFIGIYILINGIVGVRDLVTTWAIGIILLGVAGYISIRSSWEIIND